MQDQSDQLIAAVLGSMWKNRPHTHARRPRQGAAYCPGARCVARRINLSRPLHLSSHFSTIVVGLGTNHTRSDRSRKCNGSFPPWPSLGLPLYAYFTNQISVYETWGSFRGTSSGYKLGERERELNGAGRRILYAYYALGRAERGEGRLVAHTTFRTGV